MKKSLLLAIMVIAICLNVQGVPDNPATSSPMISSTNQGTIDALKDSLKNANAKLAAAHDSIKQYDNILFGRLIVDTLDLDSAMCHPELIYRTPQNIKYHSHSAINWLRFIACILIFMGLSWLAWKYTRNGALCKDESYDEKGNPKPMPERPYSFSRVQLLWWTMIVFICYIFSFAITGTLIPINSTMAILLGCGAIVYAGGRIIDNKQLGDKNQRPQDKENGKGFFEDILSDDSGVSIHRFQALVFNVIFGVAYLSYFFSKFKAELYPFISFTNWQFALIGISSATYLGLKANENGGGNGGGGQNGNGSKSGNGSGQGGNGGGQVGNQQGGQSVTQQGGQSVTQQGGQVGNQQGGQSVTQQGGQGGNQQGGQVGNQQGGQGGNQQGGQVGNQQGGQSVTQQGGEGGNQQGGQGGNQQGGQVGNQQGGNQPDA